MIGKSLLAGLLSSALLIATPAAEAQTVFPQSKGITDAGKLAFIPDQTLCVGSMALSDTALRAMTSTTNPNCRYNTVIGIGAAPLINGNGSNNAFGNTGVGYRVFLNGTLAYDNTAIGYEAGLGLTTGNNNGLIGAKAGYGLTTGARNGYYGVTAGFTNTTANENNAVGNDALFYGTGAGNSALGYQAGYNHAATAYSVAIGWKAMGLTANQATSDYSVAVGYRAGGSITSANDAVLMGRDAGVSITSGSGDTVIGSQAGGSITTSGNDTLVGYQSGFNLTAANSTALGYQSLYTNVSGTQNTALGYQAGKSLTAGGNTYVGYQSGNLASNGVNNTALGTASGTGYLDGSYGVFIGYGASGAVHADNQIAIGYNATATKSNQAVYGGTGITEHLFPAGTAIFNGPVILKGYTVATLPAGVIGARAYVTDATACTFQGALTGGASTFCPVVYTGSAWVGG